MNGWSLQQEEKRANLQKYRYNPKKNGGQPASVGQAPAAAASESALTAQLGSLDQSIQARLAQLQQQQKQ